MEEVLCDSGLGCAAIRPVKLAGKPLTRTCRTALGQNVRRGLTISRAEVAHCMLRVIGQQEMFKQTVGIARQRPPGGRIRTNRTASMIVEVCGHIGAYANTSAIMRPARPLTVEATIRL
jgi:hypothetical protein